MVHNGGFSSAEVAEFDQVIAAGERGLNVLIERYRYCLTHEAGGDLHATYAMSLDMQEQLTPEQILTMTMVAIRRLARA